MEGDRLSLDLALLHVDLVASEDDGNILADAYEITLASIRRIADLNQNLGLLTVPIGNVLVSDTRSDIEHDDTALAADIVAVAEATKLLLTRSIPHVKDDLTKVLRRDQLLIKSVVAGAGSLKVTVVKPRG